METSEIEQDFFIAGGALHPDARSYVKREADAKLLTNLLKGEYCSVLTSRQMGKSSLKLRCADGLREAGITVVKIDISALGFNVTPEQWYFAIATVMGRQLGVAAEFREFWSKNKEVGPVFRLMRLISDVVLPRIPTQLVVFIDEIESVGALSFNTDEFFTSIREIYNRRTTEVELRKIIVCLLGAAMPSDVVANKEITPFNIGTRIELDDFTEQELLERSQFRHGLERCFSGSAAQREEMARAILSRVRYWTHGHPYLTQRLCQALATLGETPSCQQVDVICHSLFLNTRAREEDSNLTWVRDSILKTKADKASVLDLYLRVRIAWRKRLRFQEFDQLAGVLRLSGIVRVTDGGYLRVRNRIYDHVFDRHWVEENKPEAAAKLQEAAHQKGVLVGVLRTAPVVAIIVALISVAVWQWRDRRDLNMDAKVWRDKAKTVQTDLDATRISLNTTTASFHSSNLLWQQTIATKDEEIRNYTSTVAELHETSKRYERTAASFSNTLQQAQNAFESKLLAATNAVVAASNEARDARDSATSQASNFLARIGRLTNELALALAEHTADSNRWAQKIQDYADGAARSAVGLSNSVINVSNSLATATLLLDTFSGSLSERASLLRLRAHLFRTQDKFTQAAEDDAKAVAIETAKTALPQITVSTNSPSR